NLVGATAPVALRGDRSGGRSVSVRRRLATRGMAAALAVRPALFSDPRHQPRHAGLPGGLQERVWFGAADRLRSGVDSGFVADRSFHWRIGYGAHRMFGTAAHSFSDVSLSHRPAGRRTF